MAAMTCYTVIMSFLRYVNGGPRSIAVALRVVVSVETICIVTGVCIAPACYAVSHAKCVMEECV